MSLNRKRYKYNETEIINLYNKGLNSVQIAEYYNYPKHTYKTISKILKKNGKILTGKRLKYTLDDENKICDLYNKGYTQLEILNMFDNINSEATIYNILSKYNVPKRNVGSKSAIKKHNYFNNINTEEKAYFLGLLMADGCVLDSNKGKVINLGLKLSDKYLIDKFAKAIGFNGKLYIEDKNKKSSRSTFNSSDGFVSIRFVSKAMFNDLSKYGIIPRKTGKEYISSNIPKEFISHFIRGCFDGDGSAFISSGYFRIAYYGSHKICQNILDIMGFKSKVYDKETVSFFSIQKKEYVEKFYNYIYKDATIYMHRKRNLFEKFMQK